MDTALQTVRELLGKNDNVAIAVGRAQNLDSMGAALSLYLSLKSQGKKVEIASPTTPLVEISSLIGIDQVKANFSTGGGDLVVSFPYKEGDIEKVSYTVDNGRLNIIVKAGQDGLTFTEKDVEYKRGGAGHVSLLFIVGTPRLSDLGNLFNPEELKNTIIVNIDNNTDNQGFGEVTLLSKSASSVSEQVAYLLKFLDLPFDMDVAQNLLSGIAFATENFQSPKTTPMAFEMASVLLKKGAVRQPARPKTGIGQDASAFFPMAKPPDRGQKVDRGAFRPKSPFPFPRQPTTFPSRNIPPVQPATPPAVPNIEEKDDNKTDEAPPDWLTPKVYKGSTLV